MTTPATDKQIDDDFNSNAIPLSVYGYNMKKESSFQFKVRTCLEARVSIRGEYNRHTYVIVIGQKSIYIKDINSGIYLGESDLEDFFNCQHYRPFRIELNGPMLYIGHNDPIDWIVIPIDPFFVQIDHIYISTATTDGQWVISKKGGNC